MVLIVAVYIGLVVKISAYLTLLEATIVVVVVVVFIFVEVVVVIVFVVMSLLYLYLLLLIKFCLAMLKKCSYEAL